MVSRDGVWTSPSLPIGTESRQLIMSVVEQWKREDRVEDGDLRQRWNIGRKDRRQAGYELVRLCLEEGRNGLLQPEVYAARKLNSEAMEGLRRWVEIENRRDDCGAYVHDYGFADCGGEVIPRLAKLVKPASLPTK